MCAGGLLIFHVLFNIPPVSRVKKTLSPFLLCRTCSSQDDAAGEEKKKYALTVNVSNFTLQRRSEHRVTTSCMYPWSRRLIPCASRYDDKPSHIILGVRIIIHFLTSALLATRCQILFLLAATLRVQCALDLLLLLLLMMAGQVQIAVLLLTRHRGAGTKQLTIKQSEVRNIVSLVSHVQFKCIYTYSQA